MQLTSKISAFAVLALAACGGEDPISHQGADAATLASPTTAALTVGQAAQSGAAVASGSMSLGVTWVLQEGASGGSLSSTGLYAAPSTAGTYHVVVSSQADPTKSAVAVVTVGAPGTTGKWVSGYWADWSVGTGSAALHYDYAQIDWSSLTHIVVTFAYPNSDGTLSYRGGNLNSALAKQVTAAAHAHGVKALLMIGGVGSDAVFSAATNAGTNAPQAFVTNILAMAQADGFDGVDIDWETLTTTYHADFKKLATALRAAWPSMILTCALGWDLVGNSFYSTLKDAQGKWLFDQFNLMNYDAANGWPGWVSWFHNAHDGAGSDHPSSIVSSLARLNAVGGVPKDRIGCGIPFYGSAWLLSAGSGVTGPRQPVATNYSAATQGADTTWTYKYITENYLHAYDAAAKTGYVFDEAAGVPYITGGTAGYSRNGQPKVTFLSYEDPASIAKKGAWIKANGYGGTVVWLINEGVVDSSGTNPLLTAVKEAFLQ